MQKPNLFLTIRNLILLLLCICPAVLYFVPINTINTTENIAQHISAIIIYFAIVLALGTLFAIGEKNKNSNAYRIRSTIGAVLGIILVFWFTKSGYIKYNNSSYTNTLDLINSMEIDKNGNYTFETTMDFNSSEGKKVLDLFGGMYDDIFKFNSEMKAFEDLIFSPTALINTENLAITITAHKEALDYLKATTINDFSRVEADIEKYFGSNKEVKKIISGKLSSDYSTILAHEKDINDKKLRLFESSLLLHEYYQDNYNKLVIQSDGAVFLTIDDSDYTTLYNDYDIAYTQYTDSIVKQAQ